MKTVSPNVIEGFVPQGKQKDRPPRTGIKYYPWTTDPTGAAIKTLIGICGDDIAGSSSIVINRGFAACGITSKRLFREIIELRVPWFKYEYEEVIEFTRELSPNVIYNRFHKMYYENSRIRGIPGKPILTGEHYINHPHLRPLFESLNKLYHENRWIDGDEITRITNSYGVL